MTAQPIGDIPYQLATATNAWAKLRRMAAYAAFDGWSLIILGTLTLIFGGYDSASGLFISFALLGTGVYEVRSVRQLQRLNTSAIDRMVYNQLVLAAALIVYAVISLFQSRNGDAVPAPITDAITQAGGSVEDMKGQIQTAMQILYLGMIAFAVMVQGSTAMYYRSRQKYLQQYLGQTPDWIQQMQRDRGRFSL